MELTISLAHFCDNHGPTSILCTQSQPVSCFSCNPQSTASSFSDLNSVPPADESKISVLASKNIGSFDFSDAHESNVPEGKDEVPHRPQSRLHRQTSSTDTARPDPVLERRTTRPVSSKNGSTECINCTIDIPSSISSRLPPGSPGSPRSPPSGSSTASSPTLRSRLPVRVYDEPESGYCSGSEGENPPLSSRQPSQRRSHSQAKRTQQYLSPDSLTSTSHSSHTTASTSFHDHTQTYITTHFPLDPTTYSALRHSIIRTLSGEVLPRGLTGGPLFFGTPTDGHTIAYTFRLPDKYARGGHRLYSLVALAGHDPRRAYSSIALIWRRFESISEWIADKVVEEARKIESKQEENDNDTAGIDSGMAPGSYQQGRARVSSFLTGRNTSVGVGGSFGAAGGGGGGGGDLFGRRAPGGVGPRIGGGLLRGRGLVEMTADEELFAKLHMQFVELLRDLGQ